MKKRRIVIASILKPIDDVRMFEKMGVTLSDSGEYEITIIGYPSISKPAYPHINFHSLARFTRLGIGRIFARWSILRHLIKVRPHILIVNTHELLRVAVTTRILFGTRIVYDIRENYYRNIRFSGSFPRIIRSILAASVRQKEKFQARFFHAFFLAEAAYGQEMKFFGSRAFVIENKAKMVAGLTRSSEKGKTTLLFSGTLAESTGVFEAIQLTRLLHGQDHSVRLIIIGYSAIPHMRQKIKSEIAELPFVQCIGIDHLVPHQEILKAICRSDFGIICYPKSPHTENSIPTKLYEYLAYRLPILLQNHQPWIDLVSPYSACIPIDFEAISPAAILQKMRADFYPMEPVGVTWDGEGQRMLETLRNI
jgi:Glycosyl transferases group 1